MSTGEKHLDDDAIIRAVIDRNGLPCVQQQHLMQCPECRKALEELDGTLTVIGRKARDYAPVPVRPPDICAPAAACSRFRVPHLRPAVMSAAVAVLLLVAGMLFMRGSQFPSYSPEAVAAAIENDRKLNSALDALEQGVMFDTFSDSSAVQVRVTDDEFYEFVLPDRHTVPFEGAYRNKTAKLTFS